MDFLGSVLGCLGVFVFTFDGVFITPKFKFILSVDITVGLKVEPLFLGDFLVCEKLRFICFVDRTVGLNVSLVEVNPGDFSNSALFDILGWT